ncbi:hypothetical protein ACCS95_34475 [Rhizobium ruizarguesonis]
MKTEDAKALAADFETLWRDDFAVLPDGLAPLVRNLFVALDGLNDLRPADRRLTWVDVSFRRDGDSVKAFATPSVDSRKWNAVQTLHLVAVLDDFNLEAARTPAGGLPRTSLEEITDMAHAELNAIRDGKAESDTGAEMAVWAFVDRWIDFGKEMEIPEARR